MITAIEYLLESTFGRRGWIAFALIVALWAAAAFIGIFGAAPFQHADGAERGQWMRLDPKPIPGCRHTAADKQRWCDAGSCPVCLHAKAGMEEDELAEIRQALDDAGVTSVLNHRQLTLAERIRLMDQ